MASQAHPTHTRAHQRMPRLAAQDGCIAVHALIRTHFNSFILSVTFIHYAPSYAECHISVTRTLIRSLTPCKTHSSHTHPLHTCTHLSHTRKTHLSHTDGRCARSCTQTHTARIHLPWTHPLPSDTCTHLLSHTRSSSTQQLKTQLEQIWFTE